jgi:6-phosphogluconolactonase
MRSITRPGSLLKIMGSPFITTGGASRGIAADPSGKFVYIANSSQILGYGINVSNGALKALSTSPYTAGNGPIDLTVGGIIK